jgi:hypothetical protein
MNPNCTSTGVGIDNKRSEKQFVTHSLHEKAEKTISYSPTKIDLKLG